MVTGWILAASFSYARVIVTGWILRPVSVMYASRHHAESILLCAHVSEWMIEWMNEFSALQMWLNDWMIEFSHEWIHIRWVKPLWNSFIQRGGWMKEWIHSWRNEPTQQWMNEFSRYAATPLNECGKAGRECGALCLHIAVRLLR